MGPVDGFSSDPLTAATAAEARSQASSAVSKVAGLEEDVNHLLMVVESLSEMLKDKHGYSDADLAQRVADIDMRDGKLNGRATKKAAQACSHCGRKMLRRKPTCVYCDKSSIRDLFAR